MPGCGQHQHSPDEGEEGDTEISKQASGCSTQHGRGTQPPSGSVSVPGRRKNICLPSRRDVTEYSAEPVVREDGKRLQGRRYINTQDNYGKEPSGPCTNSKGIPTKCGRRENASNGQSSNDETTGGECD